MLYQSVFRPLLFKLDEEKAHTLMLRTAQKSSQSFLVKKLIRSLYHYQSPLLEQNLWGKTFKNPVGLAAGFDKNAHLAPLMQSLGMGFTEVGSVTARSSNGNSKPRMFRLPQDHAVINRMGLNNDGAQVVINRLRRNRSSLPTGINIAKTHREDITGDRAIRDYLFSYKKACEIADYITVNISCPNTSDGRTFEEASSLNELLSALSSTGLFKTTPTLIKFSSDLNKKELDSLLNVCESYPIDGYAACNTSSSRKGLSTSAARIQAIGKGGLSGAPLFHKSIKRVGWLREKVGNKKPIIAAGGIDSFEKALKMLQAGATLLQIYTGLIYKGPGLVKSINLKLAAYLKRGAGDGRRHF
jgi:dihydroorotate dehydrogenase